jgi:hypothetical protein
LGSGARGRSDPHDIGTEKLRYAAREIFVGKYGEGSIALARALGIPSSPRNGGCADGVTFVVFPGSSKGLAALELRCR